MPNDDQPPHSRIQRNLPSNTHTILNKRQTQEMWSRSRSVLRDISTMRDLLDQAATESNPLTADDQTARKALQVAYGFISNVNSRYTLAKVNPPTPESTPDEQQDQQDMPPNVEKKPSQAIIPPHEP